MTHTIFSGIQPTGNIHLGNYLGAIKNWQKTIVDNNNSRFLFSIVDLHAITIKQKPEELRKNILTTLAAYIACGLDSSKNENIAVFDQSYIKEHTELMWFLSCNTPSGWLDRMTQYKDKTKDNKERECLGLYSYPVLMAADILLYNTDLVPVGEDQVQHLELTRDLAIRMNKIYDDSLFKIPEYILNKNTSRVMSLKDGTKKMSKSDESDMSRINITDSNDDIARKIKKAKTDSISEIYYDKKDRPEISNLFNIYTEISGLSLNYIEEKYRKSSSSKFKSDLADILILEISPIRDKIYELQKNKDILIEILNIGRERASEISYKKMQEVRKIFGMLK